MSVELGYLILGCTMFAVATCVLWFANRASTEARQFLDEVTRTNKEFAEAFALFKYGAVDEAIEMASRSEKRREKIATDDGPVN